MTALPVASTPRPRRLLEQVRDKLRTLHYSLRTEEAYIGWIKRYILLPWQASPQGSRGCRGRGLSDQPCDPAWGVGLDPEPGALRAPVPVPEGPGCGAGLGRRGHTGQKAGACARGADRGGGLRGAATVTGAGVANGQPDVWHGTAAHGVRATAGSGPRLRLSADYGAPGKGAKDRFVPLPETLARPCRNRSAGRSVVGERTFAGFGQVSILEALVRKYPKAPVELSGGGMCFRPRTGPSIQSPTGRSVIISTHR